MKVYADAVEKAKADCDKLMFKARQGKAQIEDAKVNKSKESVFLLLSFSFEKSTITPCPKIHQYVVLCFILDD